LRKLRGKYYIRVWIDKKETILPTGTAKLSEAKIHLNRVKKEEIQIKQRIRKELSDLNKRLSISDGVKYFIDHVGKEKNLQQSTIDSYKLACNDFKECFKSLVYFEKLSNKHYSGLVIYLQDNYNPTTTNIRLRSIRAMLNYLKEKQMIQDIPFKVKAIKTDSILPKFILPFEIDKIYKKAKNEKLVATFITFEVTGMRLGELINSHRDGEFIIVEKSKGRKQRIIPIPLGNIPDYDFARNDPYSADYITHSFKKACDAAGIKGKSLHALRHTFALRKLLETNNISIVKEMLGHSSIGVTEIYTQFPTDFLAQVFKDRNINGAQTAVRAEG